MPSYGSNIRVSDADRDEAAAVIREHYAAGRLDAEEMDERLKAAYAGRRAAQRDLPRSYFWPVWILVPPAIVAVGEGCACSAESRTGASWIRKR